MATIKINGSNFGVGPNVLLYADFKNQPSGQLASLDSADIGQFNSPHYLTNLIPRYREVFGRVGVQGREGGTNPSTDNRLTGFESQFQEFKNFAVAMDIAIPEDRAFPGASQPKTKSTSSSLKSSWVSDGALDGPGKADCCIFSWTSASFQLIGNDFPAGTSASGDFDFDGWNYFFGYACSGSSPFIDNGRLGLVSKSKLANRVTNRNDIPAYRYFVRFVVTAVAEYEYSVTFDDNTIARFTSTSSSTAAQIAQGLKASIDALGLPVSTSTAGSGLIVASPLNSIYDPTGSANLAKTNTEPRYTHLSYPAWMGNGDQTLAQTVSSYVYLAGGDDDSTSAHIALLDANNLADSSIYKVLPSESWSNTEINFDSKYLIPEATHVAITNSLGEVSVFEINISEGITVIEPPSITGQPVVRQEIGCDPGTYTSSVGTVSVVSYAWFVNGVPTGITTDTFTPVDSSYDAILRCDVTVTDGVNTETYSATSLPVLGIEPVVNSASISGRTQVGRPLKVVASVDGVPSPTVSIEWYSGDEVVATNTDTYYLKPEDVGNSVYAIVTASNELESDSSTTDSVGPVTERTGTTAKVNASGFFWS